MHHFKAPGGTVFNFNGDLSGDVHLRDRFDAGRTDNQPAMFSFSDLLAFAQHVMLMYPQNADDETDARVQRIAELEKRVAQLEAQAKLYDQECGMCGSTAEELVEYGEWCNARALARKTTG